MRWIQWADFMGNVGKSEGHPMILPMQPICNLTLEGDGCSYHASATLPPEKTNYPFYRRLDGPKGQFGRYRKCCPHWDSILRRSNS